MLLISTISISAAASMASSAALAVPCRSISFCVGFLLLLHFHTASASTTTADLLEEAKRWMREGKHTEAMRALDAAIELDPKSIQALFHRAGGSPFDFISLFIL
jgi:hypothetical protein